MIVILLKDLLTSIYHVKVDVLLTFCFLQVEDKMIEIFFLFL
jgi:hypothetical protein